ncbi:MAG: group II intron reverse transcriptase/maturase [Rhodobacteraceae bacterium]|nr:group II intron reverse transcriptase/maturase [Paracoccaceae bacterium]
MEMMERIVAPSNVREAYRRVKRNGGSPGVDNMTVEELANFLRVHWQQVRRDLLDGTYEPRPVRRHELPKPGGGTRVLGIPTVLDRLIQQSVLQVLQPEWDETFSESSFGFRPGRSAHQAVDRAREHYRAGYHRVVDLDLEKFFDRVNHDKMMSLVKERVSDGRVRRLIRKYLNAGMLTGKVYTPRDEGTPQGGPLSPLLANLLLDQLDRELEKRGHRFVRYADDVSIYVKSERAGRRVLQSIGDYLTRKLKLKVNESKSCVARPRTRSLLGFSIGKAGRVFVSDKSIRRLKDRIRELTSRTRGRRIEQIVSEVAVYLRGWRQYFKYAFNKQMFRELTSWIKRRLRCYMWKQWGRAGYRELRQRGVSRELAWNTCKSHHGPWRLSRSPALAYALTTGCFVEMGLPLLHVNEERKRPGT